MFAYVSAELTAKVFEETPRRIRLFGSLSTLHAKDLESLFATVGPDAPLLMDLSNLEGMGTFLHPLFARFHARTGCTAWWVSGPAEKHLMDAGIPRGALFQDLESARAASGQGRTAR
ncbi:MULTISPECIES: hypothetical protein [Corallococcus]|uniref:hypothetical protein n=1 Tax=Corallococcus TaxID=83461 RepID=UPI00117FE014|nr:MULTISPECIES: hypothetical protein [Corallococcus]NBD13849.1 hypothetical protein [Corallococcus silvisoli]TSC24484.1 hypothetical protein FOF48_25835 [Corallococcus sp. Z5C101001]